MPTALFGELTQDGDEIALVSVAGDDIDLKMASTRLQHLTALGRCPRNDDGSVNEDVLLVPATWPTVTQIGRMFTGNGSGTWNPQPKLHEWIMAEAVRRMTPPPPLPEDICPPWLKPYDYQATDAAAIAAAGKVLLLHDPGLGKTVISLLGLEARRQAGVPVFPMVIVVPNWDIARVWADHIAEWMPRWPKPVMHKGPNRARARGWKHRHYILITTYATARNDAKLQTDLLPSLRPAAVIADEAHMIGNDDSKQSQAVQRIAKYATSFIAASGTLVTHSMKNVYPALVCLDHRSWPSWDRTKPRYFATRRPEGGQGDDIILGLRPEMTAEFFACLDGQFVRRAKGDVLRWLPEKIYSVRRPEMPAEWWHAYDTMERQMLAEMPEGEDLPVMSTLAQLTRLSQLASSAADVEITWEPDPQTGELVPHYHVTLKRPCWKAESLLGYLAERADLPTAVFTESRQLAMLTGEYCTEAGLRTGLIVGPGAGMYGGQWAPITQKTRDADKDAFQDGKLDVIVCTAGAGGMGITLTASNAAAMLQRAWSLDLGLQPEDRVHRPGAEQWDHVEITDFVTFGPAGQPTIDQRRREVLKDKAGQLGQLVRDPRVVRQLLGGIK
jgi:hypothetical protein